MKTSFVSLLKGFYQVYERKVMSLWYRVFKNKVVVRKTPVRLHDGNVCFDLKFIIPVDPHEVDKLLYLYLPIFRSSDNRSYALPPLVVGVPLEEESSREVIYMQVDNDRNICIVRESGETANSYSYRLVVPYEHIEEYEDRLPVAGRDTEKKLLLPLGKIDKIKKLTMYNPSFGLKFYEPDKEEVKIRTRREKVKLIFPDDHSFVYPGMFGNDVILDKLTAKINKMEKDEYIEVRKITINHFLRPENNFGSSKELAYERCESLCLYIADNTAITVSEMKVGVIRENWEELRLFIQNDKILSAREKYDLSSIIDNTSDSEERKRRLRKYSSQSYRYIFNNIFPDIHYIECCVEYLIAPLTVEQTESLLKTDSWRLSHSEIYALACSYGEKSKAFADAIQTAYLQYPEDVIANLNKSTLALRDNSISLAGKYLLPYKEDERVLNNLGIYYALKSEFRLAEECFEKAISLGFQEAVSNLEELGMVKESAEKYKNEVAKYTCYLGGNIGKEQCLPL